MGWKGQNKLCASSTIYLRVKYTLISDMLKSYISFFKSYQIIMHCFKNKYFISCLVSLLSLVGNNNLRRMSLPDDVF